MEPKDYFDVGSDVAQIVGTVLSFWIALKALRESREAVRRSLRPILAFTWNAGWAIRNVGHGPALNVGVAIFDAGQWNLGISLPPLHADGENAVSWASHEGQYDMGVWYSDADGERFFVRLTKGTSVVEKETAVPQIPWVPLAMFATRAQHVDDFKEWVAIRDPEIAARWGLKADPNDPRLLVRF